MNIKKILKIVRSLTIIWGVSWTDDYFLKDLIRWKEVKSINENNWISLALLLWEYPEYRNLFIYRNRFKRVYRIWVKLWYPPVASLYLETPEIGGGLIIQHGFSTMISAETIGENCWINQQVTIGYKGGHDRPPRIGNNVVITCGAKVLGDICIGDGAVIGANAVVVHDVEAGAVMVGIPAKRIK